MDEPPMTPTAPPEIKTVATDAQSPDAFFADRQKFWSGVTNFGTVAVCVIVVILLMLRLFLV